jgi:hypothetical protein
MIKGIRASAMARPRRPTGARCGIAAIALAAAAALAAHVVHSASAADLTLAPTQPDQDDTYVMEAAKSRRGQIAQSDPALLGRTDATPVRVLVKLAYDPVASYEGDVPGLAATSPAKTGKKLRQNQAAVDAYTRYVIAYESRVLDRIRATIPTAKVGQHFRAAYGGVAMTLPANRIGDLLSIDGVVAVQRDALEQPTR